jgi:undecaprenyl phosphate N,N'-diacetylbacillosamine 1-phosphate transferase
MRIYSLFIKRLIDILVSLIILTLALPVFLLLTILLVIEYKGSPFFLQLRPGKNEKLFRVIKFRTMNDAKDAAGNLLSDGERLTSVGRMIRKTSFDEIPQLINVIIGDMSLIGPRPLLIRYLPYYNDEERKRHTVRPGITGLAQVNGRNTVAWNERLAYDVVYVDNLSFFLDTKIFFLTVKNVISSKGIVIDPGSELENFDEQRKNYK